MRRPANTENNLARVRKWRDICPDITLRSTFIVGFPGETEAEFEQLLGFLKRRNWIASVASPIRPWKGLAANTLPDPVPEEIKEERRARFMAVQEKISRGRRLSRKIGKRMTVLVDEVQKKSAIARSSADAPEIDGIVYIGSPKNLKAGEFAEVEVIGSDAHDLRAKVITR